MIGLFMPLSFMLQLQMWMQLTALMLLLKIILLIMRIIVIILLIIMSEIMRRFFALRGAKREECRPRKMFETHPK